MNLRLHPHLRFNARGQPCHDATEKQVPDPAVLEVCEDGRHHIDEDLKRSN